MSRKGLVAMLSLALLISFGHGSASAKEVSVTNLQDKNSVIELVEAKGNFIKEEALIEVTLFLSVQVSSSSLGANKYVRSNTPYNLKKGEIISINSVTWNPTGQKVQVGLIHATTGTQYWSSSFSGGSISGNSMSVASDGAYYLAIGTPSSNTTSINVSGLFSF